MRKVTQSFQSQDLDSIRSDLPTPVNDILLKRSKILDQIEEKLKGQEGIQTVALTGIGGVGKTTLARQYVYDKKASVIWEINAETKGSLMDSFGGLAYALSQTEEEKKMLNDLQDIKNPDEREEKIIILIKERLKLRKNWFLIFDNVEKFSDIQKYFPSDSNIWGNGKIIVTTRDANIKNNSHINHFLPIGELDQEERSRLFMNIMSNEKSHTLLIERNQTEKFLEIIPPFPLDISIAAYYIKTTNISYERYLENIRRYNKDFEDTQENILKGSIDYTRGRYNIITLSLQHIVDTHKDFGDLLVLMSLLDSQNIPRDLLNLYKDKTIVDNFIYHLKKYSFITDVSFNAFHTISIHRSTQAIAIDYLKKIFLGGRTEVIPLIVNTLENYAIDIINEEDFLKIKILINHLELFLNHHALLTKSMIGYIESKLGQAYSHIGHHVRAKSLLEESLVKLKMDYNKNAIKIPDILVYLGSIYRKLNHPSTAKTLLEESVTLYKKYLSESHTNMAWALSHLGLIYRNLGDYEKAQELFKQSLLIYDKKYLPKNQVRRTKTLSWLGFTHKELGNYKVAKDLLEESLILYKKHLSDSHINVAEILEYLGFIHKEMGDHNEAKISFRQSLLIYEKLFSENSYKTSGVSERVGNLYRELGDYKMAKKFLEGHLLNHKELPFGGYERAARGLKYLGIMYKETGHYELAEDFLDRSLASYKKYYAQNHLEIARVLHKLGQVYLLQKGKSMEIAERYIVQSLEIFQRNKHPDSYLAFEDLASLHLKKSEDAQNKGHDQLSKAFKDQSIQYLRQALEIVKFHFTKNSPHIIRIYSNIKALEP